MTDTTPPEDDDDPAEAAAYLAAEAQANEDARIRRLAPPGGSAWYRIGVAAALLVAVLVLVAGVRATQTDDGDEPAVSGSPGVVEHLQPRRGAEVLRQTEIGIDLAPGYEARLILNGTEIPEEELRLVPEQNQAFYTPGPGRTFETLPSGQNCVTAVAWRSAVGRGPQDLRFEWCFDVT
jgi:hypothetical protein